MPSTPETVGQGSGLGAEAKELSLEVPVRVQIAWFFSDFKQAVSDWLDGVAAAGPYDEEDHIW